MVLASRAAGACSVVMLAVLWAIIDPVPAEAPGPSYTSHTADPGSHRANRGVASDDLGSPNPDEETSSQHAVGRRALRMRASSIPRSIDFASRRRGRRTRAVVVAPKQDPPSV